MNKQAMLATLLVMCLGNGPVLSQSSMDTFRKMLEHGQRELREQWEKERPERERLQRMQEDARKRNERLRLDQEKRAQEQRERLQRIQQELEERLRLEQEKRAQELELQQKEAREREQRYKEAHQLHLDKIRERAQAAGYTPIEFDDFLLDGKKLVAANAKIAVIGVYEKQGNVTQLNKNALSSRGQSILLLTDDAHRNFRKWLLECDRTHIGYPCHQVVVIGRATTCTFAVLNQEIRTEPCIEVDDGVPFRMETHQF